MRENESYKGINEKTVQKPLTCTPRSVIITLALKNVHPGVPDNPCGTQTQRAREYVSMEDSDYEYYAR